MAERLGTFLSAALSDADDRLKVLCAYGTPFTGWLKGVERRPDLVPANLREAFKACRKGKAPWPLMVHGGAGAGKSRFAMLVKDWYGGLLIDFADIQAEYVRLRRGELIADDSLILNTGGDWKVSERYWIGELKTHRIATLDDIGRKGDTETSTARECLIRFMDARLCMPVVLISNLSPEQLADPNIYDDRVASRMCAGTVVNVGDTDMRLEKPQTKPMRAAKIEAPKPLTKSELDKQRADDCPF